MRYRPILALLAAACCAAFTACAAPTGDATEIRAARADSPTGSNLPRRDRSVTPVGEADKDAIADSARAATRNSGR